MNKHEVLNMCRDKGVIVTPFGKAWNLTGNGIDVICASLEDVSQVDLIPYVSLSKVSSIKRSRSHATD
jgi:hypothetical protein